MAWRVKDLNGHTYEFDNYWDAWNFQKKIEGILRWKRQRAALSDNRSHAHPEPWQNKI